jgi:hypothetical protein
MFGPSLGPIDGDLRFELAYFVFLNASRWGFNDPVRLADWSVNDFLKADDSISRVVQELLQHWSFHFWQIEDFSQHFKLQCQILRLHFFCRSACRDDGGLFHALSGWTVTRKLFEWWCSYRP